MLFIDTARLTFLLAYVKCKRGKQLQMVERDNSLIEEDSPLGQLQPHQLLQRTSRGKAGNKAASRPEETKCLLVYGRELLDAPASRPEETKCLLVYGRELLDAPGFVS